MLSDVSLRLESGSALSEALAQHAPFSNLFVSLVRAGEISGRLNETLNQLASYLENGETIRQKVRTVLTYPAFLLGFSLLIVAALVLWLIPAFSKVYDRFQARIPGPTLLLMDVSGFLRDHIVVISAGALLTGAALWVAVHTEPGRYLRDAFLLRLPILGSILLKSSLARFSRTLGVLTSSGIPFLEALGLVISATDNRVLRRALTRAEMDIRGGMSISSAMEANRIFPRMLISMIASGEEVGALSQMLNKAADYYDQQMETSVNSMMSLLEPVMILFLGGMIGGILLAMYLPVFTLGRAIR
jgi:type IV pilus assembly protein PilC